MRLDEDSVEALKEQRAAFSESFRPECNDNNATENVVKQLAKKLRLMESVSTEESARSYIRLLVGCYRFKRFTDATYAPRNGKAPLEIVGVDLTGKDWLQFSAEPPIAPLRDCGKCRPVDGCPQDLATLQVAHISILPPTTRSLRSDNQALRPEAPQTPYLATLNLPLLNFPRFPAHDRLYCVTFLRMARLDK